MPATKKKQTDITPSALTLEKLGVIAGGGALPQKLLEACVKRDIECFVVGFEGQTNPEVVENHNYLWTRVGMAGQIIQTLKAHQIQDLVLIGSIRRPTLGELRPDLRTMEFFARIGMRALGDNSLLSALRKELEKEGFRVHGIQEFAEDLLAPEGVIGKYKPTKADWIDIDHGIEVSKTLGELDIGQSVVVQEGIVLGVEAIEGTDQLIQRCARLKRKGRGGVLVKTCKPQQDLDLDLPTIGPNTLRYAAEAKLQGVLVESHRCLILEPQRVAEIADQHKMFVVAHTISDSEKVLS